MSTLAASTSSPPAGAFVSVGGEDFYRIAAYDRLPPFLMSIPSDTDLWMFVTSGGGVTAGRVDPDGALFPYETVDRLHDAHHHTGPITLVRVHGPGGDLLWEPFAAPAVGRPGIERRLDKSILGHRVVFEEIHGALGLGFRHGWAACDRFGWVRTAELENLGAATVELSLLDGLRNVLPFGAPLRLYQQSSCLVDAYKRADCDPDTGLAVFSLTSQIVDRPEAAEQLRANAVWCHGLPEFEVALALESVEAFRRGEPAAAAGPLKGRRGNYLVTASLRLRPGERARWHLVADAGLGHVQLAALRARLLQRGDLGGEIEDSLRAAGESLRRLVAAADGLQATGHVEASVHHFANVLFNCVRGGVFAGGYGLPAEDFLDFVRTRRRATAARHRELLAGLPAEVPLPQLAEVARATGDPDLQRLALEYLPLHFGRRHGDPSRPWNRFSIRVRGRDGRRALHYEGNWRDLFQNWEALGLAFPGYLPGFVARFVNASTVDGFNPYRLTRDGMDWEEPDPEHPWNSIGYWGDHQIVYLLKLLEHLQRFAPGTIEDLLERDVFCYANVPYRLGPYPALLEDPHATIVFDRAEADRIAERVRVLGTDGKLVLGPDGAVVHVHLLEKLLVPALAKLSNLVADAGIWMNTQRPEWNDANNALVGHGVSTVTLCYLRRYLAFLERLLEPRREAETRLSGEVAVWLTRVRDILGDALPLLGQGPVGEVERMQLLDALGGAFSDYRQRVYARGLSERQPVPVGEVLALCRAALAHCDHAIRAARRPDGLYHAYGVLERSPDGRSLRVRPLHEMLEGQVAALSSGLVEPEEAASLVAALFESRLYRPGQRSFLLYPESELPSFLERNQVPDARALAIPLVRDLLRAGDGSILERDLLGVCRFHPDFHNARDLEAALDRLAADPRWSERVSRDRRAVLDLFEEVFRHHSFTGRSGAMYAYEGLGCIYWHMVAKLLVAVQETALRAARDGSPAHAALAAAYYRIRSGLGFEKSVAEYGAFPTDPYSHTPAHGGAQQPGTTGQVKEEILTRLGELGVVIEDGRVRFRPTLLRRREFLAAPSRLRFHDLAGRTANLDLAAGTLAFSFCQVPVVYERTRGGPWIRITGADGTVREREGDGLGSEDSRALFARSGELTRLEVGVPESALLA